MFDLCDILRRQQLTVCHEAAVDEVVAFDSSKCKSELWIVDSGNVVGVYKEFGSGSLPAGLDLRLATIVGRDTRTYPGVSAIEFLFLIVPSKPFVVGGHHIALLSYRNTLLVVFEEVGE